MKVVAPSRLLAEAANVLGPVRDEVVVVGAAAIEVALAGDAAAAITPTRDVDLVVPVDRAATVIAQLEAAELARSEEPHERAFTWVRGDLKVQLVRSFHPFARPPAKALPDNPAFGMASNPAHQVSVAFDDDPTLARLQCANAACLVALKGAAFGRRRSSSPDLVERDYHDAYLLISTEPETVVRELGGADYEVRQRAASAVAKLAAGGEATAAAARQLVRLDAAPSQRAAEAAVRRAATLFERRLDAERARERE